MQFRTAEQVRRVTAHLGLTQEGLAGACKISVTTAGRWEREGISGSSSQANMDTFGDLEQQTPYGKPLSSDSQTRDRIAGALHDLGHDDLAALLQEVKRRQLAALSREFGQGVAEPDPESVQGRAQRSADSGEPNQANAG
jgi:transcriptional regulator with XRE-family HTH domain